MRKTQTRRIKIKEWMLLLPLVFIYLARNLLDSSQAQPLRQGPLVIMDNRGSVDVPLVSTEKCRFVASGLRDDVDYVIVDSTSQNRINSSSNFIWIETKNEVSILGTRDHSQHSQFCHKWCLHPGPKIWFNQFSTIIHDRLPRHDPALLAEIRTVPMVKARDLAIFLPSCTARQHEFVTSFVNSSLENLGNDLSVTFCGDCFAPHLQGPQCPQHKKENTHELLKWLARHRFVLVADSATCRNDVDELVVNAIYTQTIPVMRSLEHLPLWIADFSHRFVIATDFAQVYQQLQSIHDDYRFLFAAEEIDWITDYVPSLSEKICRFLLSCEIDSHECSRRLKASADDLYLHCNEECRSDFSCDKSLLD